MREKVEAAGGACVAGTALQSGSAGEPATRPMRDGRVLLSAVLDAYMAQYAGNDRTRSQRLSFWRERLGHVPVGELIDDDVAEALEALSTRRGRHFAGKDADGKPIFKAKAAPVTGSTINRHGAALSACLSWAEKRRMLPRGWVNPLRTVEKQPENPARTRFLSLDEIDRLLAACAVQRWPLMRVVVLMALHTGMRRGELEGLRWSAVDLDAGIAVLAITKNGDARRVPLTPAVVEALRPFAGKPDDLVFGSQRVRTKAFNFEPQWKRALKSAGIRGFTFHGLRHTAASLLVMSGASLHETGAVLGHRTASMTARYAHLSVQHKAELVTRVLGSIGT